MDNKNLPVKKQVKFSDRFKKAMSGVRLLKK